MEAFSPTRSACAGLLALVSFCSSFADGAEFRTQNFAVTATTQDIAQQVALTAEHCRKQLAIDWLGHEIPSWYRPCPIKVTVGQMGAGGATTFTFDRGEVSGWSMRVQGSLERVLDSVVPHEVSHTIFASHFRRPLPRWADEGAATLIEHSSERKRQEVLLERVISTAKKIPLDQLLSMAEYPSEMQQVYTLYAEGYSLSNFLVQQHGSRGKAVFLQFIQDAHQHGWKAAIAKHYQYSSVTELEQKWSGWVLAGSPARQRKEGEAIAAATPASGADSDAMHSQTRTVALASNQSNSVIPPLPPLARSLRQPRTASLLNAPQPGGTQTASVAARAAAADARLANNTPVTPRVAPFPGNDLAAHNRLNRLRRDMAAADQRARQISTGRTGEVNGDPVLRGQSPEQPHWSEFSAFPQRPTNLNVPNGSRVPFGG
ncbi:MAG: hypothetical protein ACK5Q5_14980 [Planctomycetaceae bacterium]